MRMYIPVCAYISSLYTLIYIYISIVLLHGLTNIPRLYAIPELHR